MVAIAIALGAGAALLLPSLWLLHVAFRPGDRGGDAMIRRPAHRLLRAPLPVAAVMVVVLVIAFPWALGFSGSHAAVAGHIAFAMGFGPIALLISALPAAAIGVGVAGGWLVASPWALGYAALGVGAWSADLVGGVALVALSAAALRAAEAPRPQGAPPTMNGRRP